MKKIITLILTFFFGERIQGEPITPPTFKSTFPEERPSGGSGINWLVLETNMDIEVHFISIDNLFGTAFFIHLR